MGHPPNSTNTPVSAWLNKSVFHVSYIISQRSCTARDLTQSRLRLILHGSLLPERFNLTHGGEDEVVLPDPHTPTAYLALLETHLPPARRVALLSKLAYERLLCGEDGVGPEEGRVGGVECGGQPVRKACNLSVG